MKPFVWLWLAIATTVVGASNIVRRSQDRDYYTLHVPQVDHDASHEAAHHVARSLGAQFEGMVGELESYYMISVPKSNLHKRSIYDEDPIVAAFQARKQLSKRDEDQRHWDRVQRIDPQVPRRRSKRAALPREPPFTEITQGQAILEDAQRVLDIKDPGFSRQWHLVNQEIFGNDINVTEVWKQGTTGNGVIVAILDDGLDYESEDLAENFYAAGSYDFNDHEDLPKPKLFDDTHGTRCAGQIAAQKNDVCGIGIAYNARVAGVRILSGEITDADEAAALNYKYQENDIFSCSWGPPDNGETMEAPDGILADAFVNGIENGRDGKGSIYVFATGNGAISGDNCNFDGYTNSIYTITVGAIDHNNAHPPYSESCSAQMVVTYSSGGGQYIYTTNVGKSVCSDHHGGTSAAAPTAAGVFALVLSVRPELTWRDLQHLCVQTAVPISSDDEDWKKLPSGRMYNHKYGYGKLDAYAIVEAAKTFELVNKQTHLELPVNIDKPKLAIPDSSNHKKEQRQALESKVEVTKDMVKAAGLLRLEHITATVNIEHERRGDLVINLLSPNKVESELATMRPADRSADGIVNWKFMTVKHWEEDPIGEWSLLVYDVSHPDSKGNLFNWTLTLFGELDPNFTGEPVYTPLAGKSNKTTAEPIEDHTDTPIATITTPLSTASTTGDEVVPARPTRLKPSTSEESIPTTSASDGDDDDNKAEQTNSTSTIVYALVGSGAIVTLAAGMYVQKRKGWRSPVVPSTENAPEGGRPTGYEFQVLRHSEEQEDEDERPLLTEEEARRNNAVS
ncbi:peptidase S8/S53 domain-containing protein [Zychaea mexicana]|uniref:peptidase S8/S53 domain-containing protein n=1 Tax=Zychaea mexicana TaxID=64656 RepID=UPI0022FDF810|nr:peptidase S8/S53 domain-containing protein [Zychaea mexicana]KAI9497583.1 peptidase S8/S53 domain-containing protein [Zychaea mexicana]